MANGFCLDSDILIWQLRSSGKSLVVKAHPKAIGKSSTLGCSALSVSEIEQGMRPGEEARTRALFDELECYSVDRAIAERGGAVVRDLKAKGITVDLADAIIAATCLVHDLKLVTLNLKNFRNVPGLTIETIQ